jgi:Phage-related replication protein
MVPRRLTTHPVEVTPTGHLVELLYDDGETDGLLFCAGHGGDVEPGTAELGLELATGHETAACWATLGQESGGGAFDSWHPPSTSITPAEYPLLDSIADRGFQTVVSIHGLADDEILVGGAVDERVKTRVARHLDADVSVPVAVASDGQYAGTHPENFVNWLANDDAGLQFELGPTARGPAADTLERSVRSLLDAGLL